MASLRFLRLITLGDGTSELQFLCTFIKVPPIPVYTSVKSPTNPNVNQVLSHHFGKQLKNLEQHSYRSLLNQLGPSCKSAINLLSSIK